MAKLSDSKRRLLLTVLKREMDGDAISTSTPISTLIEFESAGLIAPKRHAVRPRHTVYVLTDAGRAALA